MLAFIFIGLFQDFIEWHDFMYRYMYMYIYTDVYIYIYINYGRMYIMMGLQPGVLWARHFLYHSRWYRRRFIHSQIFFFFLHITLTQNNNRKKKKRRNSSKWKWKKKNRKEKKNWRIFQNTFFFLLPLSYSRAEYYRGIEKYSPGSGRVHYTLNGHCTISIEITK